MLYSEFIEMAIKELNLTRKDFAEMIGISVTSLYRILNNQNLLPSYSILEKLSNEGIDVSALDYNDIYYNYLIEQHGDEYEWISDIFDGEVEIRHKSCYQTSWIPIDKIANNKRMCPYCYPKSESETIGAESVCDEADEDFFDDLFIDFEETIDTSNMEIENNVLKKVTGCIGSTIVIPDGITEIGDYAFLEMKHSELSNIVLPESVVNIEEAAFSETPITHITLPQSIKIINDNLFNGCTNLVSISMANDVEEFGDYSFSCCAMTEFHIPHTVTKIGEGAFMYCWELRNITLPGTIKHIEANTFGDCKKLEAVQINEGVETIEDGAFENCESLKMVDFPASLIEINDFAFSCCKKLKNIVLHEGLKKIGKLAFCKCEQVREIYVPSTVESIDDFAFRNCNGLFTLLIPKDCHLSENALTDLPQDCSIRYYD